MNPAHYHLQQARLHIEAALAAEVPVSLTPVPDLLDAARAITGSDAATARRLGVVRSCVTKWRVGANSLPVERRRQLDAIVNGAKENTP